jgi:hypothetical protein
MSVLGKEEHKTWARGIRAEEPVWLRKYPLLLTLTTPSVPAGPLWGQISGQTGVSGDKLLKIDPGNL